jgi:hypothetical protein
LAGLAVLIGGYFVALSLEERNQDLLSECFSQTGEDCPNFMYYHDGGDSTLVFFLSIWVGSGLLVAAGLYWAIKP